MEIGPHQGEWQAEWADVYHAALLAGCCSGDLVDEMQRCSLALVMDYVPGESFFAAEGPCRPRAALLRTAGDLGRLLLLDMLLGNPDRLPCAALGWRGNADNALWCPSAGRLVAIDACVQRRPPACLTTAEDAACHRLTELILNDTPFAAGVLREVLAPSPHAGGLADVPGAQLAFVQVRCGVALRVFPM